MIDHDAIIRQQFFDQSLVEDIEKDFSDNSEGFYEFDDDYEVYDYPWVEDGEYVPLDYYEQEEEFRFSGTKIA